MLNTCSGWRVRTRVVMDGVFAWGVGGFGSIESGRVVVVVGEPRPRRMGQTFWEERDSGLLSGANSVDRKGARRVTTGEILASKCSRKKSSVAAWGKKDAGVVNRIVEIVVPPWR